MVDALEKAYSALWATLTQMSPYLLFGFLAAGLLSALVSPRLVEKHLGGHGLWPVFKASLLGVPLPLCSCSVLPVTVSLRKHGAGRGAATAFLISTPQTGVDSILVTLSLLGPVFAVFRPLAAFVSGVIGGVAVDALEPHGKADRQVVEACTNACCAKNGHRVGLARALTYGCIDLPRDLGPALIVGIMAAGAIAAFVPDDFFVGVGVGVGAIVVMMLLGIPVYVCATASVPVAAALMMKGVSPGAALAFLMTGPATNAAGLATVWRIMGPRTALVYLGAVAVTAFGAGVLLDYVFAVAGAPAVSLLCHTEPDAFHTASAGALLAVLLLSFLPRTDEEHDHPEDGSAEGGGSCCPSC